MVSMVYDGAGDAALFQAPSDTKTPNWLHVALHFATTSAHGDNMFSYEKDILGPPPRG